MLTSTAIAEQAAFPDRQHFAIIDYARNQAIGSISLINAVPEHGSVEMGWVCYSKHLKQPSHNAAVRLGFVPEGIFRNHMVYKGRSRDTEWLSISHDEWPQQKAAFEAWLDESNFTEDGLQVRSLESFRGSTSPHP